MNQQKATQIIKVNWSLECIVSSKQKQRSSVQDMDLGKEEEINSFEAYWLQFCWRYILQCPAYPGKIGRAHV